MQLASNRKTILGFSRKCSGIDETVPNDVVQYKFWVRSLLLRKQRFQVAVLK